jgi:hypothetical protein
MKRRTFVRTASIGVFGLGINPRLLPAQTKPDASVHHWMDQLVDATGARRRSGPVNAPESFKAKTKSLNGYFAERGYHKESNSVYFYGDQHNCCFYALSLRHTRSGLNDVLLPVLSLDEAGNWQHIATLTGFQLEALAHAASRLSGPASTLQGQLLPAPSGSNMLPNGAFHNQEGLVEIQTVVLTTGAQTTIRMTGPHGDHLNETFQSAHGLICS